MRTASHLGITTLLYAAAGTFGLSFTAPGWVASPVWPPAGVSLAMVFLFGPVAAIGAGMGMLLTHSVFSVPMELSLVISAGNTLEALVMYRILRRLRADEFPLARLESLVTLLSAVMAGATVSAIIGTVRLWSLGLTPWSAFAETLWTWWFGNVIGGIIFGPVLLLLFRRAFRRDILKPIRVAPRFGSLLLALLLLVSGLVFLGLIPNLPAGYRLEYVLIPVLAWVALRLEQGGVVVANLLVYVIALVGTVSGVGPFSLADPNHNFIATQLFLGMFGITAVFLSAAVSERRTALEQAHLAQAALLGVNNSLERLVDERTEQLRVQNTDLEDARERAEVANRAKDQFLAVMGHELRTPLQGVLSIVDLMRGNRDGALQREMLSDLEENSVHALRNTDRILRYIWLQANAYLPQPRETTLSEFVQEIDALIRPHVERAGLSLAISSSGSPETFTIDRGGVLEVLKELGENAVKFTPLGGVVMFNVSTHVNPRTLSGRLRVEVKDSGPGLPDKCQEDLFAPFAQGSLDDNRGHSGLGIGLAIARRLAAGLDGNLEARNLNEGGASFLLSVPMKLVEHEKPAQQVTPRGRGENTTATDPYKVLIVDDNAFNLRYLLRMMAKVQVEAIGADSADQALQMALTSDIDLVLMDIQMPGVDGFEATQRLRETLKRAGREEPLIFAFTANGSFSEAYYRERGFDGYLPKPLRLNQLRALLDGLGEVKDRQLV